MLKLARDLDIDNRVNCLIAGWLALDPESGFYLRRSAGRRKTGRPAKYWLHTGATNAIGFTALSDFEALKIANQRISNPG